MFGENECEYVTLTGAVCLTSTSIISGVWSLDIKVIVYRANS